MKFIRILILVLCSFFLLSAAETDSDSTFSIQGKVSFKKNIPVTVTCLTEQEFEEELPARYFYLQHLSASDLEKGYIEYEINSIPEGDYLVFAFQDKNENDKVDRILFAPREPWDIYGLPRPTTGKPKFAKLSMYIDSNLSTLDMNLKRGF
jgi:uncharacterized protein (DUF2141 family)